MTDLSLPPSTLPVPHADSVAAPHAPSAPADPDTKPLINGFAAEEEEDYTIKCVCSYEDDDGNTVQCETCETWQHIECYYPGTKGPGEKETHNCVDCEARPIDGKRATERQHQRRAELDLGDRKPKKPPATGPKGQKKKVKSETTNGWHDAAARNGASGSPRESQTSKRPKASHRPSNSTTHIVPLKLPGQSRRSASASHTLQSPSKPNSPFRPDADQLSEEFMHLYDNDPGETALPSNRVGLQMMQKLIEWSEDPDAVRRDANGKSHQDIFWRCEQPLESMSLPTLHKQTRVERSVECHGAHPKWVYLTVESEMPQNAIIGELRGQIGHMTDYVQDERNRWDDIRHPLPFVFFHPNLPIYIDTRQEGTISRYVRRSCRPNVHLKTILEGSDYHFCLVANKALQPGEQLTLPWTPDEHVRAITRRLENKEKDKPQAEGSEEDEEYVRQFFSKVLAEFGGCGCDEPSTCPVMMWSRRKVQDGKVPNGKPKRGRKVGAPKTARATGSRSGSEALKHNNDDEDEDDSHSTSASSRSKPHSRDLTPSNELDHLGPDVDDRTKRKIAALEKQEHDKHLPVTKKKKRNSGGASLSVRDTPSSANRITFPETGLHHKSAAGSASVPNTPSVSAKGRYVDAGTSRKGSNSPVTSGPQHAQARGSNPHSPVVSSPLVAVNYVDSSTQCNMDEDEAPAPKPCPRRPFQPLSQRLLRRFHRERSVLAVKKEEPEEQSLVNAVPLAQDTLTASPVAASADQKDGDGDVAMGDVQAGKAQSSPSLPKVETLHLPASEPVQILEIAPEQAAQLSTSPPRNSISSPIEEKASTNGHRLPSLQVPMPPKQTFVAPPTLNTTTPTSASTTQGSAPTPTAQTPTAALPFLTPGGSSMVQPSPVKKKLSLGDYMSRRSSNMAKADSAASANSNAGSTSSPTSGPGQSPAAKDPADAASKALGTVTEEPAEIPTKDGPKEIAKNTSAAEPLDKEASKNGVSKGEAMDVDSKPAEASTAEDTKMDDAAT